MVVYVSWKRRATLSKGLCNDELYVSFGTAGNFDNVFLMIYHAAISMCTYVAK